MSAQPQMSEKLRARMQKGAQPLLEPGETVLYGVPNLTMPMWVYGAFIGLLILPYVIQKASVALVTDRNVYVIKTNGFGFKGTRVLFKAPVGSMQVSIQGSAFPGRYLQLGDQKIWLHFNRKIQARARAIAEIASTGAPAAVTAGSQPAGGEAVAAAAEPAAAEPSPAPGSAQPTTEAPPQTGAPSEQPPPVEEPPPPPQPTA